MNRKGNQLKRGSISKNKVSGKIAAAIDLPLITNKFDCITDMNYEYYNSKFQFSDFYNKVIQDKDWIRKPRFLLEAKQGRYYNNDEAGLELAYRHLVSLYQDLDTCLQRLHDGYHDSCFVRFALQAGVFTTEHHWQMLMRNWYLGFSMAMRRYYNGAHQKYDVTSNLPYTSYFDTHFSNYLYYAIGRADQTQSTDQEKFNKINLNTGQYVRLNQAIDSDYLFIHPDINFD